MPTVTSSRNSLEVVSNQIINGTSYPSTDTVRVYYFDKTTPTTVKRKKPDDLFAGSTARLVTSRTAVCVKPVATKVTYSLNNVLYGWNYQIGYLDSLSRNLGLRPEALGSMSSLNNLLLNKIKDQKCNLAVSAAELGKTTDMVFDLARDIWKVFHSLRSGRSLPDFVRMINDPKTPVSKRFAQRFLQYTYGWTPLMLDTYGLSELLYQRIEEGLYIYVDVKKTSRHLFSSPDYPGTPLSEDLLVLRGQARYKVDSTYLRTLSQSGITNPALLIWELVPYSFVIDWVINIGDYLATLDALTGVSDLLIVKSAFFTRKEMQIAPPGTYVIDRGKQELAEKITNRLAPVSTLPSILPTYDPSIGVRRMLNATALLRNLKK